jgi:hypothetical protein
LHEPNEITADGHGVDADTGLECLWHHKRHDLVLRHILSFSLLRLVVVAGHHPVAIEQQSRAATAARENRRRRGQ